MTHQSFKKWSDMSVLTFKRQTAKYGLTGAATFLNRGHGFLFTSASTKEEKALAWHFYKSNCLVFLLLLSAITALKVPHYIFSSFKTDFMPSQRKRSNFHVLPRRAVPVRGSRERVLPLFSHRNGFPVSISPSASC